MYRGISVICKDFPLAMAKVFILLGCHIVLQCVCISVVRMVDFPFCHCDGVSARGMKRRHVSVSDRPLRTQRDQLHSVVMSFDACDAVLCACSGVSVSKVEWSKSRLSPLRECSGSLSATSRNTQHPSSLLPSDHHTCLPHSGIFYGIT
jgi:hypothetical protein